MEKLQKLQKFKPNPRIVIEGSQSLFLPRHRRQREEVSLEVEFGNSIQLIVDCNPSLLNSYKFWYKRPDKSWRSLGCLETPTDWIRDPDTDEPTSERSLPWITYQADYSSSPEIITFAMSQLRPGFSEVRIKVS